MIEKTKEQTPTISDARQMLLKELMNMGDSAAGGRYSTWSVR
jgi:hypothetical protein